MGYHGLVLYVWNNALTGTLPESLGNLSITGLDVSFNPIVGSIPEAWGGEAWQNMDTLHLKGNLLTGESLQTCAPVCLSGGGGGDVRVAGRMRVRVRVRVCARLRTCMCAGLCMGSLSSVCCLLCLMAPSPTAEICENMICS